jgi:hypothetical protein
MAAGSRLGGERRDDGVIVEPVDAPTDPARFIAQGFIVLSVPGLLLGTVSLFAREGKKWELNWVFRISGIGVLMLGALMAQKVVSIG